MGRHPRVAPLLAASLFAGTFAPSAVRADPPPALGDVVRTYFEGERAQGVPWLTAGTVSLVIGGTFLAQDNRVLRGASYPLLAVGLIEFVAGVSSLARAEGRMSALLDEASRDDVGVRAREVSRIERINSLFRVIKITEYSLLGVGAAGAVVGGVLKQDQILGAGVGLAVEAALMLTLDHFAEARAHRYAEALRGLTLAVVPGSDAPMVVLGMAGRF